MEKYYIVYWETGMTYELNSGARAETIHFIFSCEGTVNVGVYKIK